MPRLVLPAVCLALVAALPASAGPGEPTPEDSARERMVAAVLESVNLRMRAIVERARVLEAMGQHEEALKALKEVEPAYQEGLLVVRTLTTRASTSSEDRSPLPGSIRIPEKPILIEPSTTELPVSPGTRVRAGVEYLLRTQGPSGLWESGRSDDPTHPPLLRDAPLVDTAWAVLALLDATDDVETPSPTTTAVRAGIRALLGKRNEDGWIGQDDDPEAHVLATWAIAAAYSRFGDSELEKPFRSALDRVLVELASSEGWDIRERRLSEQDVIAAWTAALLHEARPLAGRRRAAAIDRSLASLADRTRRFAAVGNPLHGYAPALLFRAAGEEVPVELLDWMRKVARFDVFLAGRSVGPVESLLATTYHVHNPTPEVGSTWRQRVDVSIAQQVTSGPDAGSWPPFGQISSVRSTALHLLTILVPTVPYREPEAK